MGDHTTSTSTRPEDYAVLFAGTGRVGGDLSSRGVNERLHFVLQIDRGGTHLISWGLLLPG